MGLVEEISLRLAIRSTEKNAQVRMTVIPTDDCRFLACLRASALPDVRVHAKGHVGAIEINAAGKVHHIYGKITASA